MNDLAPEEKAENLYFRFMSKKYALICVGEIMELIESSIDYQYWQEVSDVLETKY